MNLDTFFAAPSPSVAVLGDLMLDEWIIGSAGRISPEAPVPVVRFDKRETAPGGAANVAMNLLSLGARSRVGGIVGDDEAGRDLSGELAGAGADIAALVRDLSRPTTLKTRIVAQRQQMVRVDRESDAPLSSEIVERLKNRFHPC
jgi:D-beta-D-heptose 7-phosphate kinase/D-beta-D-heptose 1-phosphate adenosyltransferase